MSYVDERSVVYFSITAIINDENATKVKQILSGLGNLRLENKTEFDK